MEYIAYNSSAINVIKGTHIATNIINKFFQFQDMQLLLEQMVDVTSGLTSLEIHTGNITSNHYDSEAFNSQSLFQSLQFLS